MLIEAGPDVIWNVLVDGSQYAEWDSGVERVEGDIGPGARIRVFAAVNPRRAFPVTVTGFVPGRSMCWTGGMPLGLFTGMRTFTLAPQDGGATRFTVREEYTGPLARLIWRSIPDLGPSFEQFATGLKHRVEGAG
nr:thioesterase superfamily protein [uncultured bacterium]